MLSKEGHGLVGEIDDDRWGIGVAEVANGTGVLLVATKVPDKRAFDDVSAREAIRQSLLDNEWRSATAPPTRSKE